MNAITALPNTASSKVRQEYRDAVLSGLVLRVGKSSKTYYYYRKGVPEGGSEKIRLGEHPQLTPPAARRLVQARYQKTDLDAALPTQNQGVCSDLTFASDDEFLTTEEAAELTKISASWYEKKRLMGSGPPYLKRGRLVRYLKNELLAWWSAGVRR